ncbi:MAG: insulinase family protein [Spirochaetes bacterium]|nr:insulinase family protein [Spirochaetota bacterium]
MKYTALLCSLVAIISCGKPYYEKVAYERIYDGAVCETLANGLTVIIKEDRRAPLVAVRCYVRTGSIHEEANLGSGLSHFFEHAMFLGTLKRPNAQRIASEVEMMGGGNFNAYTTLDHTCYLFTVGRDYYRLGIELLSDLMANSVFPPIPVANEQNTIHKEMAMGDDDPHRYFNRLTMRSFFIEHPYRYPVIGYREVYDRLSREDILSYYSNRYVPNNMVVVVVGDASRDELRDAVAKTFGAMERRALKDVYIPAEPEHTTRRAVAEYSDKVKMPMVELAFQTVGIRDSDMFALDLLASIISEENVGLLKRTLVESGKIAYRANASSWTPRDRGAFTFYGELMPGKTPADFENSIREIVDAVQNGVIAREEIERAKTKAVVDFTTGHETVDSIAGSLGGNFIWADDHLFDIPYLKGISRVSGDDIKRVAKKYLRFGSVTSVALMPESMKKAEAKTAKTAADKENAVTRTLDNGVRIVVRNKKTATAGFVVLMKGGLLYENETNNGAFHMLVNTMVRGTKAYSKEKLYAMINDRGGSLSAESGNYYTAFRMQVLNNDWREAAKILASVIAQPRIDKGEVALVRQDTESLVKQKEKDAFFQGSMRFKSHFYEQHPYARSVYGTTNTIARIDSRTLTALHKQFAVGSNIVVAAVGDMPPETLAVLANMFKVLPKRAGASADAATAPVPVSRSYTDEMSGFEQSVVTIGFRGPTVFTEDAYAAEVMCNILDGMGGRLYATIRGQYSLAYAVGCYQSPKYQSGAIVCYAATRTKERRTEFAAKLMRDEITRLFNENVTSDYEFLRAKNVSKTEFDTKLQNPSFEASELAHRMLCDIDPQDLYLMKEHYDAVRKADIIDVAGRYLTTYIETIATQK